MDKFYDRKNEMTLLLGNGDGAPQKAARFTLLSGRRRIGKTALLMQLTQRQQNKSAKMLYLFVSRQSEPLLCAEFQKEAVDNLGMPIFGVVNSFGDFFTQLMLFSKTNEFTLVIDEFQEFLSVNPAIFGEIQNAWDRYKTGSKINFIACGSVYSLLMNIFEDHKEPLFGRLTSKIILKPFTPDVIKEILRDYNPKYTPEDLLCLYMLSGGIPKYISLLMDSGATTKKNMLKYVTRQDSLFLSEGKELLVSEFGKDYGTYFSILQLIAAGKTTQSAIDSIIGKNTGAYLVNLEKRYSLINRNKPLFSKPESRNARWHITDNYLRFYFRFVFPNQALIELGKNEHLLEIITTNYEVFSGFVLEDYFRAKIAAELDITNIGKWWDKKGENEIDIIALDDAKRTASIFEVKRNAKKINLCGIALKAEELKKELLEYRISFNALSMTDM
ncbi:MAG: ATP-binding protein [Termitinemataceae bacterium]|nr:MAG: ATP-binding protein [Termitinemataceae bacterium]